MQESMVVCWFGSTGMLASARSICRRTKFIACRDMTGGDLFATLVPLRAPDLALICILTLLTTATQ